MSHKLDCTEKAWDIFVDNIFNKKELRLTPKRKKYINDYWKRWEKYREALIKADLYEGMSWSADRKYPKIDIDTKEKFAQNLLTKNVISHQFNITLNI
jgi:hypothetical protein